MALIDELKTALGVSLNDPDINVELQSLIDAAQEDLIYTADISADLVRQAAPPALIKRAIILFAKANWVDFSDDAEKLMKSYDSIKAKLAVSSFFGTYDE